MHSAVSHHLLPDNPDNDGGEVVSNKLKTGLKEALNEAKSNKDVQLMETLLLTAGNIARYST